MTDTAPNKPDDRTSVLVGRSREQDQLRESLQSAGQGHGELVLIGGESGIGKTAIVRNLGNQAVDEGAFVLAGSCYDLTITPPYGPWIEILSGFSRDTALPDLPEPLRDEGGVSSLPGRDSLFSHVLDLFRSASVQQPLVLILEDLHWADPASLDLLRFVARSVAGHRILLIVTYRNDELTRDHPLYQMLPVLNRESRAVRINLHPLDTAAIREYVSHRYPLSGADRDRLVGYLETLAEGNPFFIEELIRTLEEEELLYAGSSGWRLDQLDRMQVPMLVRQVIEGRLDRLDRESRRLLEMAAIIGQEIPLSIWQAAGGISESALGEVVERAVEAHLLVEERASSTLRFRHALVREVLYGAVVLPRRRVFHRQIAEILTEQPVPDPDAVAHHFHSAGDARALDWSIRAAERAQALYAPQAAIEHLSRAIDLANRLATSISLRGYRIRATAYATVGEFERARVDHETVLTIARRTGDRQEEWQALLDLGRLWAERDYARTGEYFREALELAREIDDGSTLAHSLNWIGNWNVNIERPLQGIEYHEEALSLFGETDDQNGIATTLDFLGMAYLINGNLIESQARFQEAVDHFRLLGDRYGEASPLANVATASQLYSTETVVPPANDTESSIEAGEMAVEIARDIGWRAGEAYACGSLSSRLGAAGEYGRALEFADRGLSIADEIEHREWLTFIHWGFGTIYIDLLAMDQAREHFERSMALSKEIGSLLHLRISGGHLARVHILQGDLERAESVLDDVLGTDQSIETVGLRVCWYARAELELVRGNPERTMQIVDWIEASTPHVSAERGPAGLSKLRGEALIALGCVQEGEAELRSARRYATISENRALLWRIDLALASGVHAGQPKEAARTTSAVRTIIDELAATISEDSLREHFLTAAHEMFPAISDRSDNGAEPSIAGLTRREMEVLRLVSNGLTDAEAADQLYLSPRTINAHLRSIYAKLDVSSRSAATRIAVEHGII